MVHILSGATFTYLMMLFLVSMYLLIPKFLLVLSSLIVIIHLTLLLFIKYIILKLHLLIDYDIFIFFNSFTSIGLKPCIYLYRLKYYFINSIIYNSISNINVYNVKPKYWLHTNNSLPILFYFNTWDIISLFSTPKMFKLNLLK